MIKRDSLIGLFLLMLFVFLISGCEKKEVKAPVEKAINVKVQPAEKGSLRPFVEAVGTLNPYEEVIVSAEVDGILKSVRVDEGTIVSKEIVVAEIDDTDYNLEVKRAEASLRQAEANLSNTRLEYQRKEALNKEGLVTKQQFDDVSTRLSLSEAELERAKATLLLSRQKLTKTKIQSPLIGIVKEKRVSTGDYVKSGAPLLTIIQINPIKLNFTVPERDIGKLKVGQEAIFKVDAFPDRGFKGKLNTIYPSLEEKTRTLQVEALVPNPDGLLKPGLFANVTLYTGGSRDAVVVPVTALLYEAEKIKVFVAEGDTARERFVKIGQKIQSAVGGRQPTAREYIEITDGVKEGELVVTVGQQNLFEGAKINVAR